MNSKENPMEDLYDWEKWAKFSQGMEVPAADEIEDNVRTRTVNGAKIVNLLEPTIFSSKMNSICFWIDYSETLLLHIFVYTD